MKLHQPKMLFWVIFRQLAEDFYACLYTYLVWEVGDWGFKLKQNQLLGIPGKKGITKMRNAFSAIEK